MNWKYFEKVRKVNFKKHFKSKNIQTKKEIRDYLVKNNFTFKEEDVENIYDKIKPAITKKQTERKNSKVVLSQKKKLVRRSNKRKQTKHVSGSMDARRKDWRMVFFLYRNNRIGV